MPRVDPEARIRTYRPKTRTGCLTCKKRRVKCDEKRPSCQRCTSTGRRCDGYETIIPSLKLTTTRSKILPKGPAIEPSSVPWYGLFTNDTERRSFQFFLEKTAPQLAGDYECSFWEGLLLQSVHHEPAIRHVTVALGSLHESFECNELPSRSNQLAAQGSFALHQYLAAMRCLMPTPTSSQPLDVCLISAILFSCFEAMRGHYAPAITHITNGLKILAEIRKNAPNTFMTSDLNRNPYIPIEVLCGLFTRLQAQAIVTEEHMNSAQFNIWPELTIDLNQPIEFHSLAEAREMLEIYTYYYRQHSSELRARTVHSNALDPEIKVGPVADAIREAETLRDTTLSLLGRWSMALDEFLKEHGASLSDRDRRGAAVLQLRKLDSFIALDAHPIVGGVKEEDSILWDKYSHFFEQMAALGESVNDLHAASAGTSSPPSSYNRTTVTAKQGPRKFSLDLGIVASMFNVAAHCRDPHIRRRAARVARSHPVQEGVWNSNLIATIAEKWIEIEEEGLDSVESCADIPAESRLVQFWPVFDVDQPSALVYFSHSAVFDAESVRREVLRW